MSRTIPTRDAERRVRPALARAILGRRQRAMDDAGMTLVELLIASTLLIVLLTAVMITMDMLNTVSNSVQAQTQEFQQALPALSPLQTLLRAEVEPSPPTTPNGVQTPAPGFATIGNFSLTFYSDIGTSNNNVTSLGTTGGPAKIVAQELDANGNAVTTSTICSTKSTCSFQVIEYLPQITAGNSNCPIAGQGGTACGYTTGKLLVNVLGITNNPNSTQGAIQPIFSYNIMDPLSGNAFNLTTTSSANGFPCTAPSGVSTVTQTCNDYIQSVGVELMVARKGAGTNGTVDEQTIAYRYAKAPGFPLYPYQPCTFYNAC
jgi:type II secretory pathway pseudopilin PulG